MRFLFWGKGSEEDRDHELEVFKKDYDQLSAFSKIQNLFISQPFCSENSTDPIDYDKCTYYSRENREAAIQMIAIVLILILAILMISKVRHVRPLVDSLKMWIYMSLILLTDPNLN